MTPAGNELCNIAILGAPGCVGKHLIGKLLKTPEFSIVASCRTEQEIPHDLQNDRLKWKQVNLSDPSSARQFFDGVDSAIYLIHSLGAKNFEELDIKLANAAGEAAQKAGVKKIIYLGGIATSSPCAANQ